MVVTICEHGQSPGNCVVCLQLQVAEQMEIIRLWQMRGESRTLRDWFAGLAMQGALAGAGGELPFAADEGDRTEEPVQIVARECYMIADAMLAARERKPEGEAKA